jgi:hypothetical protein
VIARISLLAALVVAGTAPAAAQSCSTTPLATRDGCQKAVDLANYVSPQFAAALAGGNPTIAQSGSLGGIGKFAVGLRRTHVLGKLPDMTARGFATSGVTPSSYSGSSVLVPALSADLAVGLFAGFPVGLTNILGIDGLVSGTYMSALSSGGVDVALEGSNTNFGFGGRVGITEETAVMPGIAVSYLKRDMPRFSITATSTSTNGGVPGTISANSLLVTTTSLRATIGKRFGSIDLTAGAGQDKADVSADVKAIVAGQTGTTTLANELTRNNAFVGLAVNLSSFKFVGEAGMVTGGTDAAHSNTFGDAATATRTYVTIGARIGF